ncbi:hypothetical protein Y032_0037g3528 [Ancylostoma ceylanicum]|uniref:Uncharacterized protein n=1 Tax=Ancylostoma ceylanicum TaxID=53326 RepID=A0A016ULP9_9BILA|nr:hypothetical protein Y032_0037g3528 [Ancylostoma ceylanicum]
MLSLRYCYVYVFLLIVACCAAELSPKAKETLLRVLGGKSLEERRARLQNLGALFFGNGRNAKIAPAPAAETTEPPAPEDPNNPSIEELNRREGVAEYFFQGDIQLSEAQLESMETNLAGQGATRAKRQVDKTASLWTNNIVYYYFDAALGLEFIH